MSQSCSSSKGYINSSSNGVDVTRELKSSTNYGDLNLIGTGAYGTVYKARDLLNPDQIVALKKVRVNLTDDGIPHSTLREITLLKNLERFHHPNVVKLLDVCHGQRIESNSQLVLFLVFEHVEQDLASYLEKVPRSGLKSQIIWTFSREILSGIDFLHSHRIVHRDLKPQNLLVTSTGHIKLADFGLAKTYDDKMTLTSVVVTLWYRPPEVLLCCSYNSAVDIWSAGAVIFELHSLRPLFRGQCEKDQLNKIFYIMGRPSVFPEESSMTIDSFQPYEPIPLDKLCPSLGHNAKDLIQRMLSLDASRRPTAQECLDHPYFSEEPL